MGYGLWAIKAQEQVADGFAHAQGEPAAASVFVAVMKHVAPLTQGFQISGAVVGRVVIEVSRRQGYLGFSRNSVAGQNKVRQGAAASITPYFALLIPPSPVAQVPNLAAMRPPALLAAAFCSFKSDHRR